MVFPGYRSDYFWGWRSAMLLDDRNYQSVGDGSSNSIVAACVQWICRTFPEAPAALWRVNDQGVRSRILLSDPRARMLRVLRFPTSTVLLTRGYYSGVQLWQATLASRIIDGNAYWIKIRDQSPFRPGGPSIAGKGAVTQLWYMPHWMMEPRWPEDGSVFISHYEQKVNDKLITYPVQDVVHFRYGLDPGNVRKGLSPLHSLLREVYTDEEAARFTATMLKNMGVPGLVIAPSAGGVFRGNDAELQAIKGRIKEETTGDRRGEPLVFNRPTDVHQFGYTMQEMKFDEIRHIPEERVTSALGLPAAVVGFGSGLRMTRVGATMSELRDQAWQSNLIPTQREMAEEIATQLSPDFGLDDDTIEFGFDNSRVKVLQGDQGLQAERWARLVAAGIAKRSEARAAFDLPSGPEDDIYIPQPGVQGGTAPGSNGQKPPKPAAQPAQLEPVA